MHRANCTGNLALMMVPITVLALLGCSSSLPMKKLWTGKRLNCLRNKIHGTKTEICSLSGIEIRKKTGLA